MTESILLDTPILLVALAAVGAVVLGGLVLGLVLVLGRRTRLIGIVLLALILLAVPAGIAAFVMCNPVRVPVGSQRLAPEPAGMRTANLRLWT
jgi:hypothetical protein